MAFQRKWLAAMGIESEKIEEIVAAHLEVVNGLKDERDQLRESASRLEAVQKELDGLKKSGGEWQTKYEQEHEAFEQFKADVETANTKRKKSDIYRDAMKRVNIPDKMLDALLRIADVDDVILAEDGTATNIADVEKAIKETFSDYIRTENTQLNTPDTPPNTQTGKDAFLAMSLTEQMRYANEHPTEVASYLKGE